MADVLSDTMKLTFDAVDSIIKPAFVVPLNLDVDSVFEKKKSSKEVIVLEIPVQFLTRDNWKSMDDKQIVIKKSAYDKASIKGKEKLIQDLKVPPAKVVKVVNEVL
jgi:hypothetical protein